MSKLNGHSSPPTELDIPAEKERILEQIYNWINRIKEGMDAAADDENMKGDLSGMPAAMNADISNLKHRSLMIKAAEFFDDKLPGLKWYSPESTGIVKMKLQGKRSGKTVISALINPADEFADKELKQDLERLKSLEGEKFYVVCNETLHSAAYNLMRPEVNIILLERTF